MNVDRAYDLPYRPDHDRCCDAIAFRMAGRKESEFRRLFSQANGHCRALACSLSCVRVPAICHLSSPSVDLWGALLFGLQQISQRPVI